VDAVQVAAVEAVEVRGAVLEEWEALNLLDQAVFAFALNAVIKSNTPLGNLATAMSVQNVGHG
jgi:hypothetical protein